MNEDTLKGSWKQLRGKLKETWGKLTDDDMDRAEGKWDQLSGMVQEKYGRTREEAEREVKRFRDDNERAVSPPAVTSRATP
jgi:uncharacterized protein YjbJ (UPF0337 family)